jgi:tetratricopeptide (TPR) repeat protein/tRNA A-37 threonylcarbamoyl transferase component Bud32
MAGNPQVTELLEEMLEAGRTPEEVCRDRPELLAEVRQRWQAFCRIDAAVRAWFSQVGTVPDVGPLVAESPDGGLPQVAGYEVEAILGRGGMGVVYKARHLALKRTVALKMLAARHASGAERARFKTEAEAVARLQHANVVQIHEIGEADGRPFLVMEFVAGGSLARRLAGRTLPPCDAARLVAALAEAMHLAHCRNLVHRDLKPANVLLGGEADAPISACQPKVTDFGLARQLDADSGQTQVGVVLGTPSYMAPEQAEGLAHAAGPAADVYALGAILYECLTGRPPFQGATPLETLERVRNEEPAAPSAHNRQVPRDLETICLKCLRKPPEQRYYSARELADDLGRFRRGEPVMARPVGVAERLRKWVWRHPAAAALLATLAVLIVATGSGTLLLYQQQLAARAQQDATDRNFRTALERQRGQLEEGWLAHDLAKLKEARDTGIWVTDLTQSGGASGPVQQEAELFRADANERLMRAQNTAILLKALLDVSAPLETEMGGRAEIIRMMAPGQPSVDEQYATAFRRWGLDVDGTPEGEVVARLRGEPDVVVQELVAGLDGWMMDRRRQRRPAADWRCLFRVADQLDRSVQHRRLRALLVGDLPPHPEDAAGLVAAASPWTALWELTHGSAWRQLQEMRKEIDPATAPVMTVVLLAQACAAVGDAAGAERVLRQAATARPDQVLLLTALGNLLEQQGPTRSAKAIEYYRAARAQRPRLGIALGGALIRAGRADEAEQTLRDLIRQQPDNPALYNGLGVSLVTQKRFGAAEAAYRRATELQPRFALAHYNLGLALAGQGRHGAAETAYRKAIDLRPNYPEAYHNLGWVLHAQHKNGAAEAAYRKAIALAPVFPVAYNNLAITLRAQQKLDEAAAACRSAIAIKPNYAPACNTLGIVLRDQKKPHEALAAYRKAIDFKPDFAEAYYNIGLVTFDLKELDQAVAAYRKTIALQPDYADALANLGAVLCDVVNEPEEAETHLRKAIELNPRDWQAHFNLGFALFKQARFRDAEIPLQNGPKILPNNDPRRAGFAQLSKACKRCLDLDARLAAVLQGTDQLTSAGEHIEFAQLCNHKQLYAAAARLYSDAFTADPKFAETVPAGTRYYAACAAAQAGCARGRDTDTLDENDRTRWRRQARAWLRQDLAWWGKALARGGNAQTQADVRWRMYIWQIDSHLAGLRDPTALAALSLDERIECLALWREVADLRGRVQTRPPR